MIDTRGVWMIPVTVVCAILSAIFIRSFIVTEDSRALFAIIGLSLLYVVARTALFYVQKES